MKKFIKLLLLSAVILISGCTAIQEQGSQRDYESTKKMMVDMLKTDEGKKSIQEILSHDDIKQEIVIDNALVKDTILKVFNSEQGKEFWEQLIKEPEFAKEFAKSLQEELEKTLKKLMKDPEYQGMLIDVLRDPEMEKSFLELMKSKEYREQVTKVMAESFESPYFKAQINDILTRVANEQMEKEEKEKEEKK